MAGRIENLKPWPKGVSGNPGGRPKRDLSSELAQAVFERNPEAIYRAMLKALLKGNPRAFAILADRAYGKVKQQVEIEGLETLSERMETARQRVLQAKTDEELRAEIERLEEELGYRPRRLSGESANK